MTWWENKTRNYLGKVKQKDQMAEQMKDEMQELDERLRSIGSPGFDEVTGEYSTADRLAKQLIQLENKKIEFAAAIKACTFFREAVVAQIHKISDVNQQDVLYRHYLQFQPFDVIAKEKGYSYAHILRIHKNAIQSFWEKNKDAIKCY